MKRKLFAIILILSVILLSGCATEQYAQVHRKKKSLMLLKNTELDRNIKLYKQRHNHYNKRDFDKHIRKQKNHFYGNSKK